MADAEKHRPPTPVPFQKDGDIVIQVTLRTLSGRQLAFLTFRMRRDRGCALGLLITICKPFEELEGYDYSYLLLLDGKTINCNENSHHKILEYAEHFRTIPIEEDLDAEYSIDDLVFHLDLQQIVQAAQLNRKPLGYTLQQDKSEFYCSIYASKEQRGVEGLLQTLARVYMCDKCGAVKCLDGGIDGFDGTYLRRKCLSDMLAVGMLCFGREDRESRPTKIQKSTRT